MALQERERQPRVDRLHPQAHLAQLHGQRVHVHAVDAAAHHVAERALVVVRRGRAGGPDAGDVIGEPARRREQEVSRPTGGVDDRQFQECLVGPVGMGADRVLDHRIEGAVEQDLHQLVRRVVAAGRLPCMASALVGAGEGEGTSVPGDLRDQLQQALVDVAEFVRAPCRASSRARVRPAHEATPGGTESPRQRTVVESSRRQAPGIPRARTGRRARAARDRGSPPASPPEDDADGLPQVSMPVVGAHGAPPGREGGAGRSRRRRARGPRRRRPSGAAGPALRP